ncbi:MAG: PGN_0703 family putative restriction endonuclease, partial [Anaerolineae bacterium]
FNYRAMIGKYLSSESSVLGIRQASPPGRSDATWRKVPVASATSAAAPSRLSATRAPRPQHDTVLEYMAGRQFRAVKDLFESYPEIGGVYFRPTETGVMVLDLHPNSPKPRMGVGSDSYLAPGTTADAARLGMPARIAGLERARAQQTRRHDELRFEARLIREAQANGLRLTGFPERLRFLYDQVRVGASGENLVDILAVDLPTATLVAIELKREGDQDAAVPTSAYLERINQHRDRYLPFFTRLAQVMGQLYGSPEMAGLKAISGISASLQAWQNDEGQTHVAGLGRLAGAAGSTVASAAPVAAPTATEDHVGLGPQYAGDTPFQARMRLHQSWYRSAVLRLPYGTGPTKESGAFYGNMLTAEDGERGANFLTPLIFQVVRRRLAEPGAGVEPFRLKHNMLSSQVMCFNLFAPLAGDLQMATRLLSVAFPGVVKQVLEVRLEYAPEPSREYLNDRTSFDAFVAYRRPDGLDAFLGIETKLADPFSPASYDTPAYRKWTERDDSPWLPTANEAVAAPVCNQLWRDHLLAVAMQRHPRSPYEHGRLLLVNHPADAEGAAAVEGYRALLRPDQDSFAVITLDRLVDVWSGVMKAAEGRAWLAAFRQRYLDLDASELAWQESRPAE